MEIEDESRRGVIKKSRHYGTLAYPVRSKAISTSNIQMRCDFTEPNPNNCIGLGCDAWIGSVSLLCRLEFPRTSL
jgi:hypothetical protein